MIEGENQVQFFFLYIFYREIFIFQYHISMYSSEHPIPHWENQTNQWPYVLDVSSVEMLHFPAKFEEISIQHFLLNKFQSLEKLATTMRYEVLRLSQSGFKIIVQAILRAAHIGYAKTHVTSPYATIHSTLPTHMHLLQLLRVILYGKE